MRQSSADKPPAPPEGRPLRPPGTACAARPDRRVKAIINLLAGPATGRPQRSPCAISRPLLASDAAQMIPALQPGWTVSGTPGQRRLSARGCRILRTCHRACEGGPGGPIRAAGSVRGRRFLVFPEKFVLGHFLLSDIGELNDEVHHLFLKDQRPHACERIVILLVVIPHFALAPGKLPRPLDHRPRDFIISDLDVVPVADFRKDKAKADPAVSYAAILFAGFFLGGAFLLERPVLRLE